MRLGYIFILIISCLFIFLAMLLSGEVLPSLIFLAAGLLGMLFLIKKIGE